MIFHVSFGRCSADEETTCGENKWEILRMGADIRIKCLGCGHLIMMPRAEFNKKLKKVLHSANDPVNLKEEYYVPKENIAVPHFE